ncbi:MAG: TIGR03118 family protein [Actinobacteria bacterium]|nr:MAG: TIGR03118 family protein [Actinomycetota bacterium]
MRAGAVAVAIAALATAGAAGSARADHFVLRRLVSDRADAQLVNAWGLAANATGPWWVANEARSSSTLYDGNGRKQALTVHVSGGPTGVVFYGCHGFLVHGGRVAAPARFLYACEDGMIRAWSPTVPDSWSTTAEVAVDAGGSGAVFRGLTLARGRLFAADLHNAHVLVFDSRWGRVLKHGAFVDRAIPAWYAPFGIQSVGDRIFVTYAWRAPVNGNDSPTGGYVDEFDLEGRFVARVGTSHELDEPWGVALAPVGFGRFGGDLLVANFGSPGEASRRVGDCVRNGRHERRADDALLRRRPPSLARSDGGRAGRCVRLDQPGLASDEERTTSSTGRIVSGGIASGFSISSIARAAAVVPSSWRSWRIVVNGG